MRPAAFERRHSRLSRIGAIGATTLIAVGFAIGLAGLASANDDVLAQQADPSNSVMPSLTYDGWNYALLDQINVENAPRLSLDWTLQLGVLDEIQAPPLIVGDRMYVVMPVNSADGAGQTPNILIAIDLVQSGRILWEFRPEVDLGWARDLCCNQTRGLNYAEGKILYQTLDGQVLAIDAITGELVWRAFATDVIDNEFSVSTGLVAGDLYITGSGGGLYGVRGRVSAFDVDTGGLVWSMYNTGPSDEVGIGPRFDPQYAYLTGDEPARDSWFGDSWAQGGGTVTGYFTYDVERNLFFYGTGACAPWNPEARREAGVVTLDTTGGLADYRNNFCSSAMARDAANGELIWAYNLTPADPWGLDGNQIYPLIDHAGEDAVALASANGWFYVWNRETGALLTEPWMFAYSNIILGVDLETGLPDYSNRAVWPFTILDDRRVHVPDLPEPPPGYVGTEIDFCPGYSATGWQNQSYNPELGLLYTVVGTGCRAIRAVEGTFAEGEEYLLRADLGPTERRWFSEAVPPNQTEYDAAAFAEAGTTAAATFLMANDPELGQTAWSVSYPQDSNAPLLGTASGLIVHPGNHDGRFRIYSAADGTELFSFSLGSGFHAAPVTYMGPDGRQYIVVITSSRNSDPVYFGGDDEPERHRRAGSTIYAFALPRSLVP